MFNNELILLRNEVPTCFENLHLHGVKTHSWVGAKGNLFWQEIVIGDTCFQYLQMQLPETIQLQWHSSTTSMIMAIGLQGSTFMGLAKHPLEAMQYCFLNGQSVILECTGDIKGNVAILFLSHTNQSLDSDFCYSHQLYFNSYEQKDWLISKESFFMPPLMLNAVIQLIQTSYYPEPLPFHYKLLNYIWEEAIKGLTLSISIHSSHIAALYRIRNLMDKDPCRFITITDLARYGALNRESLRIGFKSLFGKTVHGYQQQNRLNHAQFLLQNTRKPIKEIARLTGYRHLANFCIAYRKYFGYQPGEEKRTG